MAADLPDHVTHTLADYRAQALRQSEDAGSLADSRARIALARDGSSLFDSRRFTRDLEDLYRRMLRGQ
jgi:predicted O-linked N-acetylglucosamine transferase (SPINDLY family)